MKWFFLPLIIVVFFGFNGCRDKQDSNKANVKESYYLLSLDSTKVTFDKKGYLLSTNTKKPYLLVFLSTWCDYCLGQAQHMANLDDEFGDKIDIYGIFIDKNENIDVLKKFVQQSNTKFAWFYKGDIARLVDSYHIKSFPFMLLYDKDGNLVMSYDNITPEEMIAFDIKKIIS